MNKRSIIIGFVFIQLRSLGGVGIMSTEKYTLSPVSSTISYSLVQDVQRIWSSRNKIQRLVKRILRHIQGGNVFVGLKGG